MVVSVATRPRSQRLAPQDACRTAPANGFAGRSLTLTLPLWLLSSSTPLAASDSPGQALWKHLDASQRLSVLAALAALLAAAAAILAIARGSARLTRWYIEHGGRCSSAPPRVRGTAVALRSKHLFPSQAGLFPSQAGLFPPQAGTAQPDSAKPGAPS
jgi:ABC-type Fe3+ transport system permease subunit